MTNCARRSGSEAPVLMLVAAALSVAVVVNLGVIPKLKRWQACIALGKFIPGCYLDLSLYKDYYTGVVGLILWDKLLIGALSL